MLSNQFRTLIMALHRQTGSGAAKWSAGSRDDTFIWSGSSASVAVLTKDNDGYSPYIVRLIDASGRIIEEEIFGQSDFDFDVVQDLYSEARADALDITSAIKGLLDDLGEPGF